MSHGNAECDRTGPALGREKLLFIPFEIQEFQQLLIFPSPRGTFNLGAAPERIPPFSLPKIPIFVASGWCGSKTQRKSVGSWIPSVPRTEKSVFISNVTTLCSSQCVGAERENHHLAQKGKKQKKKLRRKYC